MLKKKEYRVCDRCFQELNKNGHIEICSGIDAHFLDLCEECYEIYMTYSAEVEDLIKKRKELAEKYKFGKYLPKESKDGNNN